LVFRFAIMRISPEINYLPVQVDRTLVPQIKLWYFYAKTF
jgi:hypothetical protein